MKPQITFTFLFFSLICFGRKEIVSNSINNLQVSNIQSEFSFLAVGHAYGYPSESIYPSQGLINNIEKINTSGASFLFLLGDNYRIADSLNMITFKETLLDKIHIPVFNALGNHDIEILNNGDRQQDYSIYRDTFAKNTYFSFIINSSLFVVLDTELKVNNGKTDGSIAGEQLVFLRKTLDLFKTFDSPETKSIFICGHKELNLYEENNYEKDIKPLLSSVSDMGIEIYILSGDMAKRSNSLYITKDEKYNISYVHTHLSDNKDDKILKFNISASGMVSISPISLYDLPVNDINSYDEIGEGALDAEPSFISKLKYRFYNRHFYEGILFLILCFGLYKGIMKYKNS